MLFSYTLEVDQVDLLCDELVNFSEHRTKDLVESIPEYFESAGGFVGNAETWTYPVNVMQLDLILFAGSSLRFAIGKLMY